MLSENVSFPNAYTNKCTAITWEPSQEFPVPNTYSSPYSGVKGTRLVAIVTALVTGVGCTRRECHVGHVRGLWVRYWVNVVQDFYSRRGFSLAVKKQRKMKTFLAHYIQNKCIVG